MNAREFLEQYLRKTEQIEALQVAMAELEDMELLVAKVLEAELEILEDLVQEEMEQMEQEDY